MQSLTLHTCSLARRLDGGHRRLALRMVNVTNRGTTTDTGVMGAAFARTTRWEFVPDPTARSRGMLEPSAICPCRASQPVCDRSKMPPKINCADRAEFRCRY